MAAAYEDPFELIKKGNAFEAASDHWRSAEFYSRASICLRTKADDLSSQIRNGIVNQDKRKVVSLFRAQSLEYLYKARHCLMEALRFENDQDRERTLEVARSGSGSLDPLFSMLSREEIESRRFIFDSLFSGAVEEELDSHVDVVHVGTQADAPIEVELESEQTKATGTLDKNMTDLPDTSAISQPDSSPIEAAENTTEELQNNAEDVDDRQQSIEARLAKLDSSLLPKVPPPFISGSRTNVYQSKNGDDSKNRLDEIQRGLGRLGVSLPDNNKKGQFIPENLSADDQVKLIIQQAKDEVQVEKGMHIGEGGESSGLVDTADMDDDDAIDENDSMFEGFIEDEEYDIDALLAKAENLVAKTGTEAGGQSSEYVQIKKAQALLLEARLCLEMVHTKSSEEQTWPSNNLKEAKDGAKEDDSGSASESSIEKDESPSDAQLASRNKAKELIESAQGCMNKLLKDWK